MSTAEALAAFRRLDAPVAPGGVLEGARLAEAEPSLTEGARAGFVVERQGSLDPSPFVDRLAERLRNDGDGGFSGFLRFCPGTDCSPVFLACTWRSRGALTPKEG
ncbi:hypothetical protein JBE04_24075 [Streptomyces sp. PRKS01-29]|nr:hypothetical protein [Streptomyces sabulosicollis]MBI0297458.1 hypothetical protein [Streptomyces sabulosicollis]